MLLDDVFTYLDAQSTALKKLAGSTGNLVKAIMPDSAPAPDTIVALYETGGLGPTHTFSTGGQATRIFEHTRLQLIARSTSYQTARNLAETAYTILDGLAGVTLPTATGTAYVDITAIQAPFSIGPDRNNRSLVSVNFDVRKTTG